MATGAVLVVDANPATARRIRRALRGAALEVAGVRSMAEALIRASQLDLLAVFSAVRLPAGSGYQLTRRLREAHPSLPVFLLWGGFETYDEALAREAGVWAGLRRPLGTEALIAQLEEVIGPVPLDANDFPPAEEDEELLPVSSIEPLEITGGLPPEPSPSAQPPLVGGERLASFVPNDYATLPPVKVDRAEISVGLERAVLAVLPEVVEVIIDKALREPGRLRDVLEGSIATAVADALPEVLERQVRQGVDDR